MFVRTKVRKNGYSIGIYKSERFGKKVLQKLIQNVGFAKSKDELEAIQEIANEKLKKVILGGQLEFPFIISDNKIEHTCSESSDAEITVNPKNLVHKGVYNTGFFDIIGKVFNDLGFNTLPVKNIDLLEKVISLRIAEPVSKQRTLKLLDEEYNAKFKLHSIYRLMDDLVKNEERVKNKIYLNTVNLLNNKLDIMFFDVTTLYFESFIPDELRKSGFSKDAKFKETQVVLALLTTTEGLPVDYILFPGNTGECKTLKPIIENLTKKHQINSIILTADRAMFNYDNLEYLDSIGIDYVIACKLKGLSKQMKDKVLNSRLYKLNALDNEAYWHNEFNLNNRRLIVSYSSARANKDKAHRDKILNKLNKLVSKNDLKINVDKLITNQGSRKFTSRVNSKVVIDQTKIEQDAQWDGLHGVITSNKNISTLEALKRYKGLWQIEEAFRINKHDLKMRPIYHWTETRIKAHILLCFMSYAVVKNLLHRLKTNNKPMSLLQVKDELKKIKYTLTYDKKSKKTFIIPTESTYSQQQFYKIFNLGYDDKVKTLNDVPTVH